MFAIKKKLVKYGRFLIRSHGNLSLVIPNNKTLEYVLLLILACPSFLLRQLETFALLKLPTLWWETLVIKIKVIYLKFYVRFLPNSVYLC